MTTRRAGAGARSGRRRSPTSAARSTSPRWRAPPACLRERGDRDRRRRSAPADLVLVNTCTVTAEADAKSRHAVRRARRASPDAPDRRRPAARVQVGREAFAAADPAARLVDNRVEGRAARRARRRSLRAGDGRRPAGAWPGRCRPCPGVEIEGIADGRGVGRADAGVRQGPGRLLVLLHLLHHPGGPRAGAEPRPGGRARGRPTRARGGPSRDRPDRDQHRDVRRRLVGARASAARTRRSALTLAGLVRRILDETDVERIRLSSIEPQHVDDELLRVWADGAPRTMPHLHLPLQSGDDGVLRRMGRRYCRAEYAASRRARPRGDPRGRDPRAT